jgi:hypothetical protein
MDVMNPCAEVAQGFFCYGMQATEREIVMRQRQIRLTGAGQVFTR